jgi:phage gpG-like protein
MISAKVKTKFDKKGLKRRVDDANFRSLGHASAAIRLTAKRSIRKRKKPSMPGTAPNTPTGHLRRVIAYAVDRKRQEAAIGPTNEYARTIWNLHEFGGTTWQKKKLLKIKVLKVGDYGPIRSATASGRNSRGQFTRGGRAARMLLRTQAQTERANRLIEEENKKRMAMTANGRRYPKRPFMGPALDKMRKRIPKYWQNSLRN